MRRWEGRLPELADVLSLVRSLRAEIDAGSYPLARDDELARVGFAAVQDLDRIRRVRSP